MDVLMQTLTITVGTLMIILAMVTKPPAVTDAVQAIDELPNRSYVNLGDINLGGFLAITEYSKDFLCSHKMRFPMILQYVEALVFAINEINQNSSLLQNITLGYVILDDCVKQSAATAQAVRFLPRIHNKAVCGEDNKQTCQQFTSQYDKAAYYDVVGVIGPLRSESSIAVSLLLGPAKIPQISFLSTSDELSNKEINPYFLRVVPSDEQQVEAIMAFIRSHGWTYVSVLYSDGSYGESAYRHIKYLAAKLGICIATHHKIEDNEEKNYTVGIDKLLRFPRARVVIAFLYGDDMIGVFAALHQMNKSKMFIWVGSDGWIEKLMMLQDSHKEAIYGSFTTLFYAPVVPKFDEYFRQIKPSTSNNPWFSEFWERHFNCSFLAGTCNESLDVANAPGYHIMPLISSAMDTVYVYANAIQSLLNDHCPGQTGKEARECIKGDVLLAYLKNVSFSGE